MFCEVVVKKTENLKNILRYISGFGKDVLVITQSNDNRYLKTAEIDARSLLEICPEISEINSNAISSACRKLEQYRKILNGIHYDGIPVFELLEQFILEELILLEKTSHALELKRNIVFIFDQFSFSCFALLKIAEEQGFTVPDNRVTVLADKIDIIEANDDHENVVRSIQINLAKKIMSRSKTELGKIILKQAINRLKNFNQTELFNEIERKIRNYGRKFDLMFFLTTDIDDFLIPYYKIIKRCSNSRLSYVVVSVDLSTRECLKNQKIDFVDLFDEVYFMHNQIKKTKDFENICQKLEERCRDNSAYVLCIERMSSMIKAKLAHVLSIALIVRFLLERYSTKVACIGIDGSILANTVSWLSKKKNVHTISIEPGILNLRLERKNLYKADKICIYGRQGYEVLKELGYDERRIVITGNPRYDDILQFDSLQIEKILQKTHGIKKEIKKILIAMSRWHDNDVEWIVELAQKLDSNYEIIIKIHPIYLTQNVDVDRNIVNSIKTKIQNKKIHFIYDINSSYLLQTAQLVITDYSNVGIEAMLRRIPLVVVNFAREDTKYMQKFYETGLATYAETVDEIIAMINNVSDKTHINNINDFQRIVELYNYKNDGNATERIYELILSEIR
ncbi:hypothetical protein NUZ5A_20229 [Candidatus Nitrosotenuis uzonensis]|uniref:UDP-N-acetylglucosamine 2-epimerase domain-containing protein n=1 Tax=Candidatus Nitrosotenuis uzonensis TaxID=1407055 RepID=A0A812EWJ6_9ARCH|nr:hypothetical protein NUZ5A_20229 [Candidatus Nitrosotenuis uzonensis]